MSEQRLVYIDVIRGLAILMVVINHVIGFSFGINPTSDIGLWSLTRLIQIPLFFVVSGFCFYDKFASIPTKNIFSFLRSKFLVYCISPLIFLYFYVNFNPEVFIQALQNDYKFGYWFTITLYIFMIISLGTRFIPKMRLLTLTIFSLILLLAVTLLDTHYLSKWHEVWMDVVGFPRFPMLLFFVMGLGIKKYYSCFETLFLNSKMVLFIVLGFIVFGTIALYWYHPIFTKLIIVVYPIFAVLTIFHIAKVYDSILGETLIGKILQFIGKNTLPIYFIHFFFLDSGLKFVGLYWKNFHSPFLLILVAFIVASIFVFMGITVGYVISSSRILGLYLFGKK